MLRKIFVVLLILLAILCPLSSIYASSDIEVSAPSAILIEAGSGQILFEKDAYSHRSPASVTKLMTMLLAAEAVDSGIVSLDDEVMASANAAGMGGSQIWLEEGESMSFGEMLKCVTVVSANDCCVAIAEHLAGSEEAFVKQMNDRAVELGLCDSNFLCCSGLSDSDEHYSCAYDLAMISRELLKHDFIREYTGIWTDSIRGGEFILNNTNKLIHRYQGATGLKTGFTSKAMHCLAASAQRDGAEYIAVILGAPDSASRFNSAAKLLDYAFANYTLLSPEKLCPLPVLELSMGKRDCLHLSLADGSAIPINKKSAAKANVELNLPESISAPVAKGQEVGSAIIRCDGDIICELPILAAEEVERLSFADILAIIAGNLCA